MHIAQTRWRKKIWEDTLRNHPTDIEHLLSLIELFDIWKNRLPRIDVTRYLMKELYMDAYFSIHQSCFGLYKYAHMSLRSQFETTLRLMYFVNHPIEYELWKTGNEKWMGDLLKGSDVWGQSFKYFFHIENITELENRITQNDLWLTKGNNPTLRRIYSKLSKHVHSVGPYFQTRSGRLSPKYNEDDFAEWKDMFIEVQKYMNILLALCFSDRLDKMVPSEIDRIFDLAIGPDYKILIKQICNI